jgi:Protein of unknown function (DUF2442)
MSSLTADVRASNVVVADDSFTVALHDGRSITAPLAWYPRLLHGTPEERKNWRLIGDAEGIHWPDLDEDISVQNLLLGKRSTESRASFEKWLKNRKASHEDSA